MRIRIAVPDAHVTPAVLNAALEATTAANQAMLASGDADPISELIDRGHVKWKPEPFKDGEHFDLSDTVQKRGWGDCDDLAPALAAELRESGRDPGARAVVRKSGPNLWHAETQLSDGRIIDPSRAAGMGKRGAVSGTSVMGMLSDGGFLGIKPHGNRWASRCDLPVDGCPLSLSGVAFGRSPLDAVCGAIDAATIVGNTSGMCDPADLARAIAIQAACAGDDFTQVVGELSGYLEGGEDELGSIFSKIAHGLKSIVPMAANFLPIPGAGLAAQALTHLIPGTPEHHAMAKAAAHEAAHEATHAAAPAAAPDDWALKIRKGVHVSRAPNGAFVVRF
jgi:hypothetical protein